jgi:frataxin-like iron-binding protein CyaY
MNKPVGSVAAKALLRWQPLQRQGMKAANPVAQLFFSRQPHGSLVVHQHEQAASHRRLALQRMGFHSSPTIEFPVRRRRRPTQRGGGGDSSSSSDEDSDGPINKNPLQHNAVDDEVEFVQAASALLNKLEKAMEPMKRQNEVFEIERFFGDLGEVLTIDLGPKEGKYRVEMSLDDHLFEYTSPISGKLLYIFSADTHEWVGIEDGHAFEGLLVRDLIRQCQGLPNL